MEHNDIKSIVIVGDTFPTETNLDYFCNGNIGLLFGEKICDIFESADIRICNLEGALTDNPNKCNKVGPVLVAPTNAINLYKKINIDCCTLANNHITDGGHQGVIDTIETLKKADIHYIGAGCNEKEINHSIIYELDELKIGVYNVCEQMFNKPTANEGGAWLYDEYVVCREIAELKSQCDIIIVIYHGGIERFRYPSPEIRKRFHRMVDNGANIILSQHTHCVGCEEWYNGAYLLYGQGNFLFRDVRPGETDEGIIIEVEIRKGKINVVKHLVRSIEKRYIRYADDQDFSAFDQRSKRVTDEQFVCQQFRQFCAQLLPRFLSTCRNISIIMKIIRRLSPSTYRFLLIKSYKRQNLMAMILYLRSEQKREEFTNGMESLMNLI